ncbi:hypothetical protein B0I10_110114, partial [Flavobacterium lacus]
MKLTNVKLIRTNFLNLILVVLLTFFSSSNTSIYSQFSTLTVECGDPIPPYSPRNQNSTPWCYTFNLGHGQSRMYTSSSELNLASNQSKFVFNNILDANNSSFIAEKTDFIENNDGTALLFGTIVNSAQKDLAFNYAFWLTKKKPNSNTKSNADNLARQFGINYDNLNEYVIDVSKTNSLTGINGYEGSTLKLTNNENVLYATTTKSNNDEIAVVGNFTFDGLLAERGIEKQVSNLNVNFFSRIKFFVCPVIDPCHQTLVRVCLVYNWHFCIAINIQIINVVDTTPPTFNENLPQDLAVSCSSNIPSAPTLTATDACTNAEVSFKEVVSGEGCSYEIYRIWTAEDECGNITVHKQTIVVNDTVAPTFVENLPADVAVSCDAIPAVPVLTATDNCGTAEVSFKEVNSGEGCSYEIYRIWTAEDECGNITVHKQTIVVNDTVAPAFVENLPADVAVSCDAIPAVPVLTATDNCGTAEVSFKEVNSGEGCSYEIYRIWTAEDECGNITVHKQTIVVNDTVAPAFVEELPMDMTVECDAVPMAVTLTATDNCGTAEVSFKQTRTDGNCPSNYTLVRVWTAEDECGNTTVHKQTISVQDTTAPAFVEELPMDMTVECDAVPMAVTLTATDNCGTAEVSFKQTRTDGNCPSNYTLVRVWTAEDECGNTTVHKQTITVQDTTAPAFVEELP